MAASRTKFKCPYCPQECTIETSKKICFWWCIGKVISVTNNYFIQITEFFNYFINTKKIIFSKIYFVK